MQAAFMVLSSLSGEPQCGQQRAAGLWNSEGFSGSAGFKMPSDELHGGKSHSAQAPGIGFPVSEGDRCIPGAFDAIVGEGDLDLYCWTNPCRLTRA